MKVNEIFKGIQGEGPEAGTPTLFIRLSGCNLQCDFCDTKYHTSGRKMSYSGLEKAIRKFGTNHITFTGGEPTIQDPDLNNFVRVNLGGYRVALETNGTRMAGDARYDSLVISPKKQQINPLVLRSYTERPGTAFKFVYEDKDKKWWEEVIKTAKIPNYKVWIMPEGATREEQLEKMPEVMEYCLKKGFKFSPRLHVLGYDTKRGV